MSHTGQRDGKPNPLIDERPALMRPTLAAQIGVNKALILERIWYLQNAPGRGQVRKLGGRDFLLYPLALMVAEMPYIKASTIRRLLSELAEGCCDHGPLISKQTMAGTASSVWYSVDRDAVEHECSLFRQAQLAENVGENSHNQDCDGAQIEHPDSAQIEHHGAQNEHPHGARIEHSAPPKTGGKVLESSTVANILNAGARQAERELEQAIKQEGAGWPAGSAAPEESGEAAIAAIEALKPFGIEPGNATDLLRQHGLTAIVDMTNSARRLRAGGFKFEDGIGTGWVVAAIRGRWHRLTDEEVTQRITSQRRKSKTPRGPANVPSDAHQAAQRAQAARDRYEDRAIDELSDVQWGVVVQQAKAVWARSDARPFPPEGEARDHNRVRAIVRGILFPSESSSAEANDQRPSLPAMERVTTKVQQIASAPRELVFTTAAGDVP